MKILENVLVQLQNEARLKAKSCPGGDEKFILRYLIQDAIKYLQKRQPLMDFQNVSAANSFLKQH